MPGRKNATKTSNAVPIVVEKKPLRVTIAAHFLRLLSTLAGAAVEYHEVYSAKTAQWALVFLGLWLMGVPPALWFDGLRRISEIARFATEAANATATEDSTGKGEK